MRSRATVLVAAGTLLVLLAGCSGGGGPSATVGASSPVVAEPTDGSPAPDGGTTLADDEAGLTLTLRQFVPRLTLTPQSAADQGAQIGDGVVAAVEVEVTLTPDSPIATVSPTDFWIECDGVPRRGPDASLFDADLAAAGHQPFGQAVPGTTADGWLTFVLQGQPDPSGCTLGYVYGGGAAAGQSAEFGL